MSPEHISEAFRFLSQQAYGVVALEGLDPKYPHVSLVYYWSDEEHCSISFITKKETHKYMTIVRNPHVSFLAYAQDPAITVRCEGVAQEITVSDPLFRETFDNVVGVIKKNHTKGNAPIYDLNAGTLSLITIAIHTITYSDFSSNEPIVIHRLVTKNHE